MLIEAELLPQGPQFASNIPRFGEEPENLTKMLPEPDNTILMSVEDHPSDETSAGTATSEIDRKIDLSKST